MGHLSLAFFVSLFGSVRGAARIISGVTFSRGRSRLSANFWKSSSDAEVPPGASGAMSTYPGEEAYYVIEGATAKTPYGSRSSLMIQCHSAPHAALNIMATKA